MLVIVEHRGAKLRKYI